MPSKAEIQRKYRESQKAKGLCVCCKEEALPGKTKCQKHNDVAKRLSKQNRRKNTLGRYGITEREYERMYEEQGGCCLICGVHKLMAGEDGVETVSDVLCIDHCHKTGKVRGLLCSTCNVAIGHLEPKLEHFGSMISYLEEHA